MSNCCPEFYPIKVSQLARYTNIDLNDFLLVIESGSANYSRRSTISDLINSFKLHPSGSYSGSFSGSFYGKIKSKNANLTGALSGSYQGSILSKNTTASGSFSGSFYGNSKLTGSFTGNHYGFLSGSILGTLVTKNAIGSGSFSGSTYGKVVSKNTKASGSFSGSIFGKIVSKNIIASGSLSGSLFGRSTRSLTSSYLLQGKNQSYKFTHFDGSGLINNANFSFDPTFHIYYISSSNSTNYLVIDSKATVNFAEAGLILSNNYNRKNRVPAYNWGPEGWRLFSFGSGSLSLSSLTGSYQFTNENFTPKGFYPYFSALKTVNNVFYFWPEPNSYNTINRDASIAIGLTAPNTASNVQRTKARLHISVFSSSTAQRGTGGWPGSGTVRQLDGAIYVDYGSSSLQRTFYVSGSGNMYTAGTFTIDKGITGSFSGSVYGSLKSKNSLLTGSFRGIDNITNFKNTGKNISLNATSSYTVSASYALYATNIVNTSTFINRKTVDIDAGGWATPATTITHGCPTTPYMVIANWVAKSGGSTPAGFNAGDVLAFENVYYFGNESDINRQTPGASIKISGNDVIIGWPNYGWGGSELDDEANVLNGNASLAFQANKWYLRLTFFY